MSHNHVVYPMPTPAGPGRDHAGPWLVREPDEDADSAEETDELLALTDIIQRKLRTAEALAWVLHGSDHHPSGAEKVTAGVIAELLHEAAEAYDKQWEIVRKYKKGRG